MGEPDSTRLARIIGDLGEQSTAQEVLDYIVSATRDHIPAAEHAGLTLLRGGNPTTAAATGDVIRRIEAVEYQTGQGPCISAALEEPFVHTPDLAADERWPRFSARVAQLGLRSMLSVHFGARGAGTPVVGALNVYAAPPGAFDEQTGAFSLVLAPLAAVILGLVSKTQNLKIAVQSRHVIGQAKGILMERHKLTADQAFDLLTAASQAMNTKIQVIAAHLAETGQLKGLD